MGLVEVKLSFLFFQICSLGIVSKTAQLITISFPHSTVYYNKIVNVKNLPLEF